MWKAVVGYEGIYEVSDVGDVRSLPRTGTRSDGRRYVVSGRVLRCGTHPAGHKHVMLCVDGHYVTRKVHHLVAEAFLGPWPEGATVVRHLNDDPADNRSENLAYGTQADNIRDCMRNGNKPRGERHSGARLTRAQVTEIKEGLRDGVQQKHFMEKFGVSQKTISDISVGKTWKHVEV